MGFLTGTVKDASGTPLPGRVVRAYRRDTGALLGSTISDNGSVLETGAFSIDCGSYTGACTVVVYDLDAGAQNALVFDRVIPV